LPDYSFKAKEDESEKEAAVEVEEQWPAVSAGTSVSGIVGGILTLALAAFTGFVISLVKKRKEKFNNKNKLGGNETTSKILQ